MFPLNNLRMNGWNLTIFTDFLCIDIDKIQDGIAGMRLILQICNRSMTLISSQILFPLDSLRINGHNSTMICKHYDIDKN